MTGNYKETGYPHFEIPKVSETLYRQTREALENKGYTFVVDIKQISIAQLSTSDTVRSLFGYINNSEKMKSSVPPQIEIVIDPRNFKIESSILLSVTDQIVEIKKQEDILKSKLPENIRNNVSLLRSKHASILVQLDFEHQRRNGSVLFTRWYGGTYDKTDSGNFAIVGRDHLYDKLSIPELSPKSIDRDVFAISAIVLPRISAA